MCLNLQYKYLLVIHAWRSVYTVGARVILAEELIAFSHGEDDSRHHDLVSVYAMPENTFSPSTATCEAPLYVSPLSGAGRNLQLFVGSLNTGT